MDHYRATDDCEVSLQLNDVVGELRDRDSVQRQDVTQGSNMPVAIFSSAVVLVERIVVRASIVTVRVYGVVVDVDTILLVGLQDSTLNADLKASITTCRLKELNSTVCSRLIKVLKNNRGLHVSTTSSERIRNVDYFFRPESDTNAPDVEDKEA